MKIGTKLTLVLLGLTSVTQSWASHRARNEKHVVQANTRPIEQTDKLVVTVVESPWQHMGRLFENLAPAMAWIQTLGQPEIGEGLQHLIPLLDDMATLAQQLEIPDPTGDVRNVIERGQDPTANAGALIMVLRLTFDRLTDTVRGQMPPGAAEFGKPGDPVLCSVTRESVNRFGTPSKRSVAKR